MAVTGDQAKFGQVALMQASMKQAMQTAFGGLMFGIKRTGLQGLILVSSQSGLKSCGSSYLPAIQAIDTTCDCQDGLKLCVIDDFCSLRSLCAKSATGVCWRSGGERSELHGLHCSAAQMQQGPHQDSEIFL